MRRISWAVGRGRMVSRSGKREGEKGEDETAGVRRKCVDVSSADAFEKFSHGEDSESCGNSLGDLLSDSCGLSECVSEVSSGVSVVIDVLVSLSSAVTEVCEGCSLDSDGKFVKAPRASRMKIMQPVPEASLQSSYAVAN